MDEKAHADIIFPLLILREGEEGCVSCQKILANGIVCLYNAPLYFYLYNPPCTFICTRHPCTFTARPQPSKHVDIDQLP